MIVEVDLKFASVIQWFWDTVYASGERGKRRGWSIWPPTNLPT